jgi:branched-subunit amino acid ABC-type transport system permease component
VLAAAAAVILTIESPQVTNTTGLNETILVLVGVVVGGIDRLLSATLGGFAIGFAISFLGFELAANGSKSAVPLPFTSSVFLPSVIYVLVIVALLLRPAGLFAGRGQMSSERV